MSNHYHKHKAAVLEMIKHHQWGPSLALSLTVKQSIVENGIHERVSIELIEANFHHLLQQVSRKLYRNKTNAETRINRCFAVVERSRDDRYHIHAQIEIPDGVSPEYLRALVQQFWPLSKWGHKQMKIRMVRDSGWIHYLLKQKTKPNGLLDSIDFTNFRNHPSAPSHKLCPKVAVLSVTWRLLDALRGQGLEP